MECDCIDMDTLDTGYDVFYVSLTYELLVSKDLKKILKNIKNTGNGIMFICDWRSWVSY